MDRCRKLAVAGNLHGICCFACLYEASFKKKKQLKVNK